MTVILTFFSFFRRLAKFATEDALSKEPINNVGTLEAIHEQKAPFSEHKTNLLHQKCKHKLGSLY